METRVTQKPSSNGIVEVKQNGSWYYLYVGGALKANSTDFDFIMREYDKYN